MPSTRYTPHGQYTNSKHVIFTGATRFRFFVSEIRGEGYSACTLIPSDGVDIVVSFHVDSDKALRRMSSLER